MHNKYFKNQYDPKDLNSILEYAKNLENSSLKNECLNSFIEAEFTGKGEFGKLVEKYYFGYNPNSNPEPDFPDVGVELKTTPLKKNSKGLISKERLVFNIINYNEEYKHKFSESNFWKKNSLLLLLFYLHETGISKIDLVFKIIRFWRFPITDLKIIKDDWEKIISIIKAGKAHELSEGDTMYLGACTKGSTAIKSLRTQPFSTIKAKQRAFSLKSKYLNFIIQKSLNGDFDLPKIDKAYNQILNPEVSDFEEDQETYNTSKKEVKTEPIIKDISDYEDGQTFEELIIDKFSKFYGYTEKELLSYFSLDINPKSKSKYYSISKAILGVSKDKIEEFEKGEILLKSIRLEKSSTLKESMSFAQINFKTITKVKWENSYWNKIISSRFFFVIFQKNEKSELVLKKVLFWTMPFIDREIARVFWEDTKSKIIKGDFNSFYKISDNKICHVRPKGQNSKDLMETISGTFEKKKSYWLNSKYILKQIM